MSTEMRPSWVVLAPVTIAVAKRALPDNLRDVQVDAGSEQYVAIVEMQPGSECCGELELAAALSTTSSGPCYVLWTNIDNPAAQVFERGARVGDLAAGPDDVARAVGCSFPGLLSDVPVSKATLEVVPDIVPPPNDPKIDFMTAAQWGRQMKVGDWAEAFDPAPEVVAQVRAALEHPRAEVRRVAATLAGCCAAEYAHPDGGLPAFIAKLQHLAQTDPDPAVRAEAKRSVQSQGVE